VLLPPSVLAELTRQRSPTEVRFWAQNLPGWCEVRQVALAPDDSLSKLDPGERDAILLALQTGWNAVLMDDLAGRREAIRRTLDVTGTLGVLHSAAQRGWIDFGDALRQLDQTSFRISPGLRRNLLELK
jgi:predicted nucleic acid-binding protein